METADFLNLISSDLFHNYLHNYVNKNGWFAFHIACFIY